MKSDRSDLYKVLHVDPSANPLVIQAAYRVLAQIFHPDVSGDDAEMKRINAAWEVLGDARKRRQYDIERAGRHAPEPAMPTTQHRGYASAPVAARPPTPSAHASATHASDAHASTAHAATPRSSTAPRQDDKAGPPVGPASGSLIKFGRYEGWTVGQVARVDPPFLEWLRRVPLGRALKPEIDLALQRADGARRMGLGSAGSSATVTNDQPVHTWAPGAPTRVR